MPFFAERYGDMTLLCVFSFGGHCCILLGIFAVALMPKTVTRVAHCIINWLERIGVCLLYTSNKAQADKKGLKAARKAAGLTQKQLAAQSGVKLRAIQLYEQNQLDLRRASVSSALALASTLSCAIEDLVWQPVALEYDSRAIPSVKL